MLRTAYRVLPCSRSRKPETRRNLRKSLRAVWKYSGTAGNLFTQFGNALELAEIFSRNLETYRNGQKFLRAVWEHAKAGGNSFARFGNMLEPAEIRSRSLGIRRNLRKFVRASREHARTNGNFFPQFGNMPKPAEIVAAQCAAYRVLPCSHRSHFCTLRYQKPSKLASVQVGICIEQCGDTVARFRAGLNHISNLPPQVCGRKSPIKRSSI